jgi:hypothetical protein
LINSNKTLPVLSLKQAHVFRCLSGLFCNNERLERTTWNAPSYPSIFCISFARLVRWLVYLLVLAFTTPTSQVPFDVERRCCIPLTPTTLHPSSLSSNNLIGCNISTFNTKTRIYEDKFSISFEDSCIILTRLFVLIYSRKCLSP